MTKQTKNEPAGKVVEWAWNSFFNEDPVRGQKAADAAGRDLLKKLTDGINADNRTHKNTPETVLPILTDVAMGILEKSSQPSAVSNQQQKKLNAER